MDLRIRFAVIPAKAGIQYAGLLEVDRSALEYWVIRFRGR